MRVILHIGQQKTGSTALQHALVADRERLAEHGIVFPDAGHQRGNNGLLRPSHNGIFFLLQGNRGPKLWQSLDEIRDAIHDQIDRFRPETVIISAEHAFMAADQDADVLAGFDELLPGPKEVVVYLRRPDQYLTSFHKQQLRFSQRARPVTPLHEPERIDYLEGTCQLDHRRALSAHLERYGTMRVFDYGSAGNTIEHFYRHVVELDPPRDVAPHSNPSIPDVFANLAIEHIAAGTPLSPAQIAALVRHGDRERVDLLGPHNRRRVLEYYRAHDAFIGSLVGRAGFFDDIERIAAVPSGSIDPDEANRRYRAVFDALVSSPSVYELRRDCRLLEEAGMVHAAQVLVDSHRHALSDDDVAWFEADRARTLPPEALVDEAPDALHEGVLTRSVAAARRTASATVRRVRAIGRN